MSEITLAVSRISSSSPDDSISLWLVKWLLFRLMFASGVVKLTSRCPTWWGLTALNWHYESQVGHHAVSIYYSCMHGDAEGKVDLKLQTNREIRDFRGAEKSSVKT